MAARRVWRQLVLFAGLQYGGLALPRPFQIFRNRAKRNLCESRAEGLTHELQNLLSRLPDQRASHAMFSYAQARLPLQEMRRQLSHFHFRVGDSFGSCNAPGDLVYV